MSDELLDATIRDKILGVMKDDEIVGLTRKIIAIPSHRFHPRQETDVAEFIMREFKAAGIETFLQEAEPGRCNVIGRLGKGKGARIMLNGHIDTVPAEDMADPYAGIVRDGNLHGRGASDMKGGVAAMAYAMLCLKRAGVEIPGEVIFAGVIAEEQSTSHGSLYVSKHGPEADMAVVGEPTSLEVIIAHKGFDNYVIDVKGVAAHSSRPDRGVNAIAGAALIIRAIQEDLIPRTALKRHPHLGCPTINVAGIQGAAKDDSGFFSGDMTHIPGAIVPDHCRIYIDRRRLPGENMEDILEDFRGLVRSLQKRDPMLDASVSHMKPSGKLSTHPPLETSPDSPLVRHCLRWAAHVLGREPKPTGVPFWSDAALFNEYNRIPAIVYGPGDIATAHSKTECVPVSQLTGSARVYALLAASAASLPGR